MDRGQPKSSADLTQGTEALPDGLVTEALLPARDFPNRHASILLAWEATLDAMDQALADA